MDTSDSSPADRRAADRTVGWFHRESHHHRSDGERTLARESDLYRDHDRGPILVAVNGRPSGGRALDWAAAEAASRGCALRIVHVISGPTVVFDPLCTASLAWRDPEAPDRGQRLLDEAARRARLIAHVPVTTHLEVGSSVSSILKAGRDHSLVVVGRGHPRRFGRRSVSWRVARRARNSVTVVELLDDRTNGPSAGRIVVGIDGSGGPPSAIAFAFQAAARRAVGLTAIHACAPWRSESGRSPAGAPSVDDLRKLAGVDAALLPHRDANPGIDVRRRFAADSACSALLAESAGAAMLIVGSRSRWCLGRTGAVERVLLRSARCPVTIVRAPSTMRDRVVGTP